MFLVASEKLGLESSGHSAGSADALVPIILQCMVCNALSSHFASFSLFCSLHYFMYLTLFSLGMGRGGGWGGGIVVTPISDFILFLQKQSSSYSCCGQTF